MSEIVPVLGEIDSSGTKLIITLAGGNDWAIQDMAPRLQDLTPTFSAIPNAPLSMSTPLTWAAVVQLSHMFAPREETYTTNFGWTPGPNLCNWILYETMRRSCQGDVLGQPPARLPMAHQSVGGLAIGMNGRFLLADDMGTGKSQSAAMGLAECEARRRPPWPALIVCPATVVDSWLEDLALVYPGWRVMPYRGTNRQRLLKSDVQVLITSWETMRNDVGDAANKGPLIKHKFGSVVFDEAHKLCNYDSRQSTRGRRLAAQTPVVIEATGTPITKNAGSFWPLLNCLDPHGFPNRDRYKGHYCLGRNAAYGDTEVTGLDPRAEPEFRIVMQGTWRRVSKADVLKDLPPKTYQTRYLELPAKYRKSYDEMEEDMLAHLPDVETPLSAMTTLAKMMRLSQLAHASCNVWTTIDENEIDELTGRPKETVHVEMQEPSWKVDALMGILDELHQGDAPLIGDQVDRKHITHGSRPVVAFAPLKQLVMLAGERAKKEGYRVGYIVGGMNNDQRTAARHAFQGNELDLLCVTTGAGGVGLTLTAADTCVFLMRPWNRIEAAQAEDRLHRRGQTKNVQIIDLVAKNTIEARIRAALKGWAQNLSELVQDPRIARELFGGKS